MTGLAPRSTLFPYTTLFRSKSSVARIRLQPGAGEIVVNARPLDAYFGRETSRMIVHQPFEVTSTAGQYRTEVSVRGDRKSTRLNSSHQIISYAVFCLKKKKA